MMPPNCCLCERSLETGDECELVTFARRPEDEAWYEQIEATGMTGHPPNVEWFCDRHATIAQALCELTIDVAMQRMKNE